MQYFIKAHTKQILIGILFGVASIMRLIHAFSPSVLSWDGSVYVGMGKFLYSHGAVGLWEVFRPVGMPVLLGFAWKVGIDPYVFGIVIAILSHLGIGWILYKMGEKIMPFAGLLAASVFLFSPIIFIYSNVPMSDIPSAFLALAALAVASAAKNNRAYFFAGFLSALAFLFRFSQGLIVVAIAIVIIVQACQSLTWTERLFKIVRHGAIYALGFFVLVAPYFIAMYHFYGDPLIGLKEGNAIIKHFPTLYHKGTWFYLKNIYLLSPLLYFALIPFGLLFTRVRKIVFAPVLWATLITFVIYIVYFSHEPHKEIRYAFAFVPYLALLAGAGIAFLWQKTKISFTWVFVALLVIGVGIQIVQLNRVEAMSQIYREFYNYFADKPGAVLASATPVVANNDILMRYPLYDNWAYAEKVYMSEKNNFDYLVLDSCNLEIACSEDTQCTLGKERLHATLAMEAESVFSATSGRCQLEIYKTP